MTGKQLLFFFSIIILTVSVCAQNPDVEQRKLLYRQTALSNFNNNAITIQAYEGVPVDQAVLNNTLANLINESVSDFDIVKLVRVLMLSNGEYDSLVIPVLETIPFWLQKDEDTRVYWSENHMIMWMSSDWLLYENYPGWTTDVNLRTRLVHFLQLKNQYGFYEFFSTTYAPYTLTGLLNLADFSQDAEIKQLATIAAQKLMIWILAVSNDAGVIMPAAGRNYYGHYVGSPYSQNVFHDIYMLTGVGPAPANASHSGGFFATSSIDVDTVLNTWMSSLDTVFHVGHPIESFDTLHAGQSPGDKIMFQWSGGGYFHPYVAGESAQLMVDSNLWPHPEFAELVFLSSIPVSNIPTVAENLSYASKSTVICGQDVHVFKNGPVVLSSAQDFWKGKWGYQSFPCVASVGTTAVITIGGKPELDPQDIHHDHANDHLPCVTQQSNVALMMFWPEIKVDVLGPPQKEVMLYFNENDFDETAESNGWVMGRQGDAYVAVYKPCSGMINGVRACYNSSHQSWVTVVGSAAMYSDFATFQSLAGQAHVEETFVYDALTGDSVFYASVTFDTTSVDYTWSREYEPNAVNELKPGRSINVYPNPSSGLFTISGLPGSITFDVYDLNGKRVVAGAGNQLNISTLNNGSYLLRVTSEGRQFHKLLLKK